MMFSRTQDEITHQWVGTQPVVSICCITYNHENYIKEALDSFLMQVTNFPFEILINDDASTDKTSQIIKEYEREYPDLLRPIYQVENQKSKIRSGMNPRFNYPRAKGKFIALCDGDDYWTDPYKLQKQVDFLEENNDVGIIHAKHNIYYEVKDEFVVHERKIYRTDCTEFENYLFTGDMRTCTVAFRAEYLTNIGKLLTDGVMDKMLYGDRATFLTVATKSKIVYMDEVLGVYRVSGSASATRHWSLYERYRDGLKQCESLKLLCHYLNIENQDYLKFINRRANRIQVKLFFISIPLLGQLYDLLYRKVKKKVKNESY